MYSQIESNKRKTWYLIIIFSLIILLIGWVMANVYGYGYGMLTFAGIFAILTSLGGYYKGDVVALRSSGAVQIKKEDNPYVYRMVENLCITSGQPTPKVHIINSPALNAFATGRDPEHASIALTTGIIDALENEELEGVIAHELSHVKNYDIRVMTVVVVLVGFIAILSDWFLRASLFGGRKSDSKNGGGALMLIGFVLILLSPIVAKLIQLAVSRKREYLADASGALLTRYPEGLARALEKIGNSNTPLQSANAGTAHLFFAEPFKKKMTGFFSTHPPISERVKALRGM